MVTRLGFLEHLQVLLEFIRRLPGRAVDARQHLVVFVAAPVGPGDRHQLEGRRVDLAGVLDVRPAAQVREGIALVERDFRLGIQRVAVFVQAAFFQAVDQFQLVGLVLEDLAGFIGRYNLLDEGVPAGDDLAHAFLDLLQVILRDRLGQVKIIVETVLDRRADGVLGLRVEFQHGLRHDVRGRVADAVKQRIFVAFVLVRHFCLHKNEDGR